MSGNTAELESLLVGPYLWSTIQHYDFYHDVSNLVIKANKRLKKTLNDGKKQVFGTSDFVEMMGVEYWDILKKHTNGEDQYKLDSLTPEQAIKEMTSVVLLLKLIRDKIEHMDEYKKSIKDQLNNLTVNGRQFQFFHTKNGESHLNKHEFIAFWKFKFPKLAPFLWLALYKSKAELPKYYPDNKIKISHFQNTPLDVTGYLEGLSNALTCDMENGNVFRRFKGQGGCSLQLRGFHKLNKVLHGNEVVTMAVNPDASVLLSVSHSSSPDEVMEYIGDAPRTEKIILIFAANITDDEVWKNCKSVDCRVVIFCDPDRLTNENIEEALAKFKTENSLTFELSDFPIKGYELSIDKQIWLFKRRQVFVQGREMNINDIFWNMSTMSWNLSGNALNKLLKNKKPTLFENHIYPENKGVYIERRLSRRNDKKLEHIYVVVNYDLKDLSELGDTQVFNNIKHLENEIDKVKSDCEFILLKEHEISDEMIEKCDDALSCRCVRFVDPFQNRFQQRNSRTGYYPSKDKTARRGIYETEFLKIIRTTNIKTFFFHAESGMGKSNLLISLGKQLENSLVLFCSFRKFIEDLLKNVGTNKCTKTNVKGVILETLVCEDECERNVIDHWLDKKGGTGAKVELQLDGLDEVPTEHLQIALQVLKIIENDFGDSVRLWITSSRPFPSEMEEIKYVEWNISPFTLNNKLAFFAQYLTENERLEKGFQTYIRVENFVSDIISLTQLNLSTASQKSLTDYPLFCSMIAELYENDFTEHSTLPISLNRFNLYESLASKKFAGMMTQKIGDNNFKTLKEIYMRAHKYFALVHLFPKMLHKFSKPSAMKHLTQEEFCKMRILTSIGPPAFVHLSYAHFFAALFINDGVKTGELDHLCSDETFEKFLVSGAPDESDVNTLILLWEIVDSCLCETEDCSSLKWLENYHKEKHCNVEYNSTFLTTVIENKFWHLGRLLLNAQKSRMDFVECNKIIELALSQSAPSKWVIEMCKLLTFDKQNELLICSVQNGDYETAKYFLIDILCGNGDKVFDEIAKMSEDGGGIFHCIVDLIKGNVLPCFPNNFIDDTKQFIMFVHENYPKEIKRRDNRGQTFLMALPRLQAIHYKFTDSEVLLLKKFLVEDLNADVNERWPDGESILSLGQSLETGLSDKILRVNLGQSLSISDSFLSNQRHRMSQDYHKLLALVASNNFAHINLKSEKSGLTPLQEAVHIFGWHLGDKALDIFRDLGANFNEVDQNDNTILHHSVKNCDCILFIKLLVEHGCKIDVQNGEGLCALCLAENNGKFEFAKIFREQLNLREGETCRSNCASLNKSE